MEETKEYSNREINLMFKEVQDILQEIKIQTTKTNGSVANIQKWRERVTGGIIVMSFVCLPLLSWALYQITQIENKVNNGISRVLSNYEITVTK